MIDAHDAFNKYGCGPYTFITSITSTDHTHLSRAFILINIIISAFVFAIINI